MIRDVLTKVAAFVDGRSYAGECNQVTLPELNLQTEEFRGGGMDAPVEMDMGMEALRSSLEFLSVPAEVMKLFGKEDVPLTLRGLLKSSNGTKRGATAELRGKFIGQNPNNWQAGQQSNYTATFAATYYKLTIGGEVIHEIDTVRVVRIIDGVDQLADDRRILGL